ncbi:unnamed protein product [Cladocopium goreaui]|uniref:Uncharacterized protein n=1 Tax=Cladocopium goreaui TaxID=2562237 RepID=A0A9P1GPF8_9DINO|nr:unnamed protein product [Cladocopium goreaui]
MAACDMDETPTDGLEELGEACQHQLQAYAAVERANGKGACKGSGKGKDKGKGKGKRTCQSEGKQSLESYKQPPKKRAKKGEQLPESAAAPKAAPARLEISAVVPLNTHDRRWDQLATIKGKSTGSLAFQQRPPSSTSRKWTCKYSAWERLPPGSRHRAAAAGTVTTAIMGRQTLEEAEEAILRRRPIQLQAAFRDWKLSNWVHKAVACAASEKSHVHILSEDGGNMVFRAVTRIRWAGEGAGERKLTEEPEAEEPHAGLCTGWYFQSDWSAASKRRRSYGS